MGLRANDLKDLVYKVLEVDTYKSKMGEDKDIVTLCFSVKEQEAAKDLENFLESGYDFVLDADITAGEQSDGTYKVFVEIERNRHVPENIMEIADGVKKLANVDLMYRYHKNFRSNDLTQESLEDTIPLDKNAYESFMTERTNENYETFFDNSYLEETTMVNNVLTMKKAYADPIQFKFIDFGPAVKTIEGIKESFNANDFSEIIFLSKYIGDYNITKYGHKLTFENKGNVLVLERITV
jgi:hypothetical protein